MGPHPVPQNVTSFQFKLVGDMTLKQFGYLAAGVTVAYVIFVFLSTPYPLVAWPLILIFASIGAAFAFLPIGSRPLDHWLKSFLKAIYSPTKRYWVKDGKKYTDQPLFNSRYVIFKSAFAPAILPLTVNRITQPPINPPVAQNIPAPTLPTSDELKKTVELARQAQALQMQIIQTERTLNQIKSAANKPTAIPVNYSQEVNKILENLQTLMTQASDIKAQLNSVGGEKVTPKSESPLTKEKIRIVLPEKPKQAQVALTTFPNVISGIIRDSRGTYLPSVVAVIYDREGLPVRALKTNKLGQFSGSTPLSNGTYTLELEKEGFTFDTLQITLDGQILLPLLIMAKE